MGVQNIREKLIEAVTIAQAFDLYSTFVISKAGYPTHIYLLFRLPSRTSCLYIRKTVSYHNVLS